MLVPKRDFHMTHPKAQGTQQKRKQKNCQQLKECQETLSSAHDTALAFMNSQKPWIPIQDLKIIFFNFRYENRRLVGKTKGLRRDKRDTRDDRVCKYGHSILNIYVNFSKM